MTRLVFAAALLSHVAFCPAQSRKDLRDSLSAAVEILEYHPDSLDLRLKKAAWNLQLEQWQYAKDEYDYILERDDKNIAALYYRAFANERLGRYSFARIDYETLLTHVPGHFESRLGLALLNQKDRRYTEALDRINQLVSQFPDSAVAYAARAGIEAERGMNELAIFDYDEAIRRDPGNTDYRIARIDRLIVLNRRDEALQGLNQLTRMGVPRAALAALYRRCGKR